jgi:hypothetical protein
MTDIIAATITTSATAATAYNQAICKTIDTESLVTNITSSTAATGSKATYTAAIPPGTPRSGSERAVATNATYIDLQGVAWSSGDVALNAPTATTSMSTAISATCCTVDINGNGRYSLRNNPQLGGTGIREFLGASNESNPRAATIRAGTVWRSPH